MFKIESYKRGLAISTIYNFIAKVLLFIQTLFIAYYFPVSQTDIFFFCYSTITLAAWFVNSLDHSVIVPRSMRIRERLGDTYAMNFLSYFLKINIILGLFVTVIFFIYPVKLMSFLSGFSTYQIMDNIGLLYFMAPLFCLMTLVGLLNNILVSYRYFTMPSITSVITSLIAIGCMFLFQERMGISSVALGLTISFFLNAGGLIALLYKQCGWHFHQSSRIFRLIKWKDLLYSQSGNIITFFSNYFPYYLLSGYPTGIVTALNYGQKTSEMPTQLIVNQVSSVVAIKLNEIHSKKNHQEANATFISSVGLLLFITIPISAISFFYADTIISVLYARGKFQQSVLNNSAYFFMVLIWLLPLVSINTLCARIFMSVGIIREAFYYQSILNILSIILVTVFVKYFGYHAYPYAVVLVYTINIFTIKTLFDRYVTYIKYKMILSDFIRVLVINIPSCFVLWIIIVSMKLNPLLSLLTSGFIYVVILVMLNQVWVVNKDLATLVSGVVKYVKNEKK